MKKKTSKKYIFLLIIAIAIAGILILQFVFNKPIVEEITTPIYGFTQEFYADIQEDYDEDGDNETGWNQIIFPATALMCTDGSTEEVFETIIHNVVAIYHHDVESRYGTEDNWVSFYPNRNPLFNDLTVVYPHEIYWVHVNEDCILRLCEG